MSVLLASLLSAVLVYCLSLRAIARSVCCVASIAL